MRLKASWGAIGVTAIALVFLPGMTVPHYVAKWALWGIVLAAMAVARSRDAGGNPRPCALPDRRIFITALCLVLWSSMAPLLTAYSLTAHAAGILRLCTGFSFAWLVAMELQEGDEELRGRSLFTLGIGGAIIAVIVLLQAAGLPFPGITTASTLEFQAPGSLGNPNWAAAFLLPLVPLLLGMRASLTAGQVTRRTRTACVIMAACIAAAVMATRSKAGAIALAAGIIVYVLLDAKLNRRIRVTMIVVIVASSAALLAWCASTGILHALPWTRGRLFIWEGCLMLIARHPLTGIGLGGFQPAYPLMLPQLLKGDPAAYMPLHRIEYAHNDVLQMAVEAGLSAAILLAGLVMLVLFRAYRSGDGLSRGVASGLAAMALYACFDSPLQLPATLALWWFLAGWMMAGRAVGRDERTESVVHHPRYRTLFAALIIALGVVQAARFGAAHLLWARGSAAQAENEYQRAAGLIHTASMLVPENARLLSATAKAHLLNRDPEQALRTVDRALRTGFSFDDLFLRQKAVKQLHGETATVEEWKRMAREYPGLFRPHIELARFYLRQNDHASARTELEMVLRIRQNEENDRLYKQEAERMLEEIKERAAGKK